MPARAPQDFIPWMISISQFGFREESALAQSRIG
jgi:hypothetical protein